MNYKDALNVSINDRLTKAKLIEIANTLQDQCLLNELDDHKIISFNSYIKDVKARWDIHQQESKSFIDDVLNAGRNTRKALVNAINSESF